ncbi:EAL domain-containing protein [Edaphobacter sp. HDX4]|uniref:putative bifunctional diguanylate cyclase/phosphodiesterase n=1 Tax=Edaphobacter sp. HDX4 TaxID=2794064 RepID=UPI002FE5F0EE
MDFKQARNLIIRHRKSLGELSIVALIIVVGLYLTFEYDLFTMAGHATPHEKTIELDEALLLGAIVSLGLLVFSIRHYLAQKQEMKRRVAAEQHVRELAFQDALTGLPNRRQFDQALRAAVSSPPREGAVHAVFLLDLNGFKQINDTHGHGRGDEVLVITAQRLLSAMRDGDLVARIGGDEFAILAQHLTSAEAATSVALRVIEALAPPIQVGPTVHHVGSGIGIALFPDDAVGTDQLLRKADLALYRAKEERRSAVRFFEEEMDKRVQERQWLEQELRSAVRNHTILAHFRPSVDLKTRRVIGFEASPVWHHPSLGEISPDRFLPIAEESGLIHELADQILLQACTAAARWPSNVGLSINVLSSQIKDRNLKQRILNILEQTGLRPERLEIEITESSLVRDIEAAQATLGALKEAGVQIALDNFGTGYSSLYHLRNFKLDKIKIDSSFIREMMVEKGSSEIVHALVGLAQGLGLKIAAEGIQNEEQEESLLRTGCEQGQGYLFSEFVSAEHTLEMVQDALPALT